MYSSHHLLCITYLYHLHHWGQVCTALITFCALHIYNISPPSPGTGVYGCVQLSWLSVHYISIIYHLHHHWGQVCTALMAFCALHIYNISPPSSLGAGVYRCVQLSWPSVHYISIIYHLHHHWGQVCTALMAFCTLHIYNISPPSRGAGVYRCVQLSWPSVHYISIIYHLHHHWGQVCTALIAFCALHIYITSIITGGRCVQLSSPSVHYISIIYHLYDHWGQVCTALITFCALHIYNISPPSSLGAGVYSSHHLLCITYL